MAIVPNTFPFRSDGPMFKGTKAESRAQVEEKRQAVKDNEDRNKTKARQRDDYRCRFPRCGCHARRTVPEVAHAVKHKGMGGDPLKQRSKVTDLICACPDRHQHSRVSFHAGTLAIEAKTKHGTNGPVRWWVDKTAVEKPIAQRRSGDERWVVVAEEERVGVLKPVSKAQAAVLAAIAELKA